MKYSNLFLAAVVVGLIGLAGIAAPAAAQDASTTVRIIPLGVRTPTATAPVATPGNDMSPADLEHYERELEREEIAKPTRPENRNALRTRPEPAGIPVVKSAPVRTSRRMQGFEGLDHAASRSANGGNQFSGEPPDTVLCSDGKVLMEGVNTVLQVFSLDGKAKIDPVSLNEFFGAAPAINRATGDFGPDTGDVKCYYDPGLKRWFITSFLFDTGDIGLLGPNPTFRNFIGIAVSQTSDPLGAYNVYLLDGTNDGELGTPLHAGCPCLPDQPLIGADSNVFIVTTNEFGPWPPDETTAFHGAQVYAFDKFAMARGAVPRSVVFENIPLAEDISYSIQPQQVSNARFYDSRSGGTAYFLSALDFFGEADNRIAAWALSNTRSVRSGFGVPRLTSRVLTSQAYGFPPTQDQKDGPTPLRESLGFVDPLAMVEANDDRMQQAWLSDNVLWGGLNTAVSVGGATKAGIAWFAVNVGVDVKGRIAASVRRQGRLAVANHNVSFPAIAATDDGDAYMSFTLMGPDFFPSAAWTSLDDDPKVNVVALGTEPEDGFSAYADFGGGGVARWGDYAGAIAIGNSVYTNVEYISGTRRTAFANWSSFVTKISR